MIIGISAKMGCGKTHLTAYLTEMLSGVWTRISLGDALKKEVSERFDVPLRDCYSQAGKNKVVFVDHIEAPSEKMTLRALLQWWGTDVRRKQDNNYWVNKTKEAINRATEAGLNVVVDDIRFVDEMKLVKDLGGKTIRIQAYPGYSPDIAAASHASETSLDGRTDWDIVLSPAYGQLKEAATYAAAILEPKQPDTIEIKEV